jgi:hypothetical protein
MLTGNGHDKTFTALEPANTFTCFHVIGGANWQLDHPDGELLIAPFT